MKRDGFQSFIPERIELELQESGFSVILGCDEAGRGPLAGPVVAASVRFEECEILWKCRDSKSLRPAAREQLYEELIGTMRYAVSIIDAGTIDHINIRVASIQAMTNAALDVSSDPNIVLVDGRDKLPGIPQSRAIIKGDMRVAVISAASIIAKVSRDRLMLEYHAQYPQYGFDRHFGYPTAEHRKLLKEFGPCPIHRRSYRGVRELLQES
jgi:ribonuclease HII